MNRGKTERIIAQAMAVLASTLNKLAMDCILYMGQNYNFISFPEELTTGSSIMPHKKNPDVWEIMRARCGRLIALPNEISMICQNLPSGYHRDLQLIKEHFIPALAEIRECVGMSSFMLQQIIINEHILDDEIYSNIYSVEAVQQMTQQGMPFRDAYREVARKISSGDLRRPDDIKYSHEGSVGNLCNDRIMENMKKVIAGFDFESYQNTFKELLAK
jgi:argininosuccinate lyase